MAESFLWQQRQGDSLGCRLDGHLDASQPKDSTSQINSVSNVANQQCRTLKTINTAGSPETKANDEQ